MRRLPVLRLLLLSLVVLAGVGLFLVLAPRTVPLVTPAAMEAEP
ncbi:MAG TPA: hypothetical protein VJK71_05850 [Gemmatimonadales bacterium]|nr:hypothetical protein [Gemmatimonadales bacterium]